MITNATLTNGQFFNGLYTNGKSGNLTFLTVNFATTGNINLSSAPSSVDGELLQIGNSILVKNQTPNINNNGHPANLLYIFNGVGNPLLSVDDYQTWTKYIGLIITVAGGTINKDKQFVSNATKTGELGVTPLLWANTADVSLILVDGSIQKIGNVLSLKEQSSSNGSAFTGIDADGNITTSKLKLQDLDGAVTNSQTTADVNNTSNAIVLRDENGNFIANNITANLDGTANGNMPLVDVSANNNILIATDGTAVDSGKSFVTDITGTSTDNQVPTAKSVYDLQSGNMKIHGLWNATANVPHLDAGIGTLGECYSVSVSGSQTVPSGVSIKYKVGDLVYYANDIWNCLNYGTGSGSGTINTVTATGTDGITMTSTTTDGDVVIDASLDDTLPAISSELTTIGTLPTTLDTDALADNDNINTAMSKLQGQINNIATSNGFLKNNINVAKNGDDATNIPLTINGGLAKLDGSGTITLSSGTYDVPTNSINNVSIIGTSVDYCIINSTNTTVMPINDNVSYSFSNITFGANCSFIIESKNVNLSFFNCKFNSTIIIMQSQSTGNLYFDRCTVELYNSSMQIDGVNATFNNSTIRHSLWGYGSLYVYNCKYYADSIYTSNRISDVFYVENSDSNGFLIKNFGYKFRWYNFISPNNEFNNNTKNGIIIGGTGYLRQLNNVEIGEIYGYEKIIFIKHSADKNAVITLFPISKYGLEIDNVTFTINMYIVSPQTITIKVADGSGDKIGDYLDDIRTQSIFKNRSTISLTVIYSKKIFLIN